MQRVHLHKMVLAALFAALCCVFTMVVQIPSPMNGYVNLGDCMVLTAGWVLGGGYGFLAAGVGSALADLFAGYAHYAIATFLIKGIMALLAAWLCTVLTKVLRSCMAGRILSALVSEVFMVLGYFFFAGLFLGKGVAAVSSVPGNLVQGAFGAVAGVLLTAFLLKIPAFRSFVEK